MKIKHAIFFLLILTFALYNCKKNLNNEAQSTANLEEDLLNYAPKFTLEDVEGKYHKLADFEGKVILIDIWATWCGPCIRQIPYLKKLEEQYKDKPFEIVSVSVDKEKDKEKWKNFVNRRNLGGVQLYAGKATPFSTDYNATRIPKFVLVGKKGEILVEKLPQALQIGSKEVNPYLIAEIDKALNKG